MTYAKKLLIKESFHFKFEFVIGIFLYLLRLPNFGGGLGDRFLLGFFVGGG
jgi:hypothetical protein